ncbi:UNVERIFIED_CONTAM: hypothetical protein GTU68_047669, partial [Idotea baltica]|nr:hypothetical protein [Idotea baltica]
NFERYTRQISLKEIGKSGQKKISNAKIIVIGAGGLGTPVLQYLVGAGVGKILLFDKDVVSLSNLQRQVFYTEKDIGKPKAEVIALRLKELNKDVEIEVVKDNFGINHSNLVSDYDAIVDGSDNFGTRYLLNDISLTLNIPLVSASIFGFEGQVSVFNYKGGPSLRCLYKIPPSVLERPACDLAGVLGASVGILGSIQALEVIKVILNREDVLTGKLLYVKLLSLEFSILLFDKNIEVINDTKILPTSIYEEYNMCSQELLEVTYEEFKEMEKSSEIEILDVRTEEEREEFNIGGKHISIQEIKERLGELDRSKDMLVYCKSGGRSARAIEFLKMNSYSGKLYNLKDGITPLKK